MSENEDLQSEGSNEAEESHNYLTNLEHRVSELMHNVPESIHDAFSRHRRSAFEKHPFIFSTLGLLGLVATWQGFDKVIQRIDYLDANPEILLIIGLIILLFTGRLYRQLDK